jgi:hypothetical protein
MHAYRDIAILDYSDDTVGAENLDELWADEDFCNELMEAINENFILEVEASLAYKKARQGA